MTQSRFLSLDLAISLMTLALLILMWRTATVAGEQPKQPEHSIVLSAAERPFVFGRNIPLRVSYRNGREVAWVIPTPMESVFAGLQIQPFGSKRAVLHQFGRETVITTKNSDGQIITDIVSPIAKPMSIAPGKSHQFEVQFERDWSGNTRPGRWTAWVEDEALKIESNRLEIPLEFAPDSVDACLEIALDTDEHLFKRKWHAEWLKKLKPDLPLDWPREKDPEAIHRQKEPRIQAALKEFASFWEREKDSESMTEAIRKINDAAGLKPPAAKVP